MAGALGDAVGVAIVTDARRRVGFPHEGQNFFEASLHILRENKKSLKAEKKKTKHT